MVSDLGTTTTTPAPPAARAGTPGWRDPRLWIGVLIVAGSVVAGAGLVGAADDTVSVWAVADDMGAGDRIDVEDLVATRVRFAEGGDLAAYFTLDDELPPEPELVRGVGAGELLPRAALGSAGESGTLEVPVAVAVDQVPGSVRAGSVVDVYLVPSASSRGRPRPPGPALAAVTVVDAPPLEESFAATGKRQLVLAVEESAAAGFFELLGSYDNPVLTVVRRS